MLNRVILMGRLTADPELRKTASDLSVTSFTLAVDRNYGKGRTVRPTSSTVLHGVRRRSSSADIFPKAD